MSELFPFRPEGSAGVREQYGYLTEVITADDGSEQRALLRAVPLRTERFRAVQYLDADRQRLAALIDATGGDTFLVPLWFDAVQLGAGVSHGTGTLVVEAAGRAFQGGGALMLWRDNATWEVRNISGVSAHAVELMNHVEAPWGVPGTLVVPLVTARLAQAATVDEPGGPVNMVELEFSAEAV